jgi:hypothetical protein
MSISRSRTFSQFSSRRLLLATALVASCVCAFAGQASASVYPAHTVLNYCSNRAGLGKVVRGTYHGLGFLAWDSNRDGRIDHMAIDTNRDRYVDLAIADTNEDGTPDWVGVCNGRAQLWYRYSYLVARLPQRQAPAQPAPRPPNAAANAAWGEMMPGLSVLYGINPIGPDLYSFDY